MPEDRGSARRPVPEGAGDLVEALAEGAGAGRGGHPSDDELLGYRAGELERAAEERTRDHLVGCRECTVRLLDLDALSPDPGGAEAGAADFELAAAWRDLRSALPAAEESAGRDRPPGAARAARALAAVLALAVVGFGLWVTRLQRDVERLAAPQANLPVLYLDGSVRATGRAAEPELAAPGADERVLLIVTPADGGLAAEYRAVLAAEGGREVWRGGLRPSDEGTLRVLLPGRLLRPGRYELRLGAAGEPAPEPVRHPFTVLPEVRPPSPETRSRGDGEVELLARATVERRLAPGEIHLFRVPAAAGDFLDVTVEQLGLDVVATLADPSGEPLLEADAPVGDLGPEILQAVAETDGHHRLVVRAWGGDAPPGRYRVTLQPVHPASARDRRRAEAARLFARGESLRREGGYVEATETYRSAGRLARELGDVRLRAEVQDRVCTSLWLLRQVREALVPCRASVALFRREGDLRREAMALTNEGVLRFRLGELDEAVRLYGRALELAAEAGDAVFAARVRTYRGQAHQVRDEIQAALDDYAAALPAWQGPHRVAERAHVLQNLGVLYRLLGRPDLARDRLEAARAAWTEAGDERRMAATLNQLGELAREEGRPAEALALFGRSLELRRAAGDPRGSAKTLEKLALLRLELGRVAEARPLLAEALELLDGVDDPRARASVLRALGSLDRREGRPGPARSFAREALELYRRVGDTTDEAGCLLDLARAERALGSLDAALAAAEEALALLESVRLRSLRRDLRTSFFATAVDPFDFTIDLLMELHRARPGEGFAARGLAVAEQARARSLLDGLTESDAGLRGSAPPELLARERELRDRLEAAEGRRRRLAELAEGGDVPAATARAAERPVRELVAELEEVRARMRAASPRYASLERPRPLVLAEVQDELLDAGTLLLEYRLGGERSHLWVISRDAVATAELPPRAAVEEAARRAHDLLRRSQRRETRAGLDRELCRLSRMVLGPVAGRLGEARLVIVPDGALAYVPFAALPGPAGAAGAGGPRGVEGGCRSGRPLVVDHEITYLPSASALGAIRRRAAERSDAAGVVAVVADPAGTRLPFARREGEAILALAPPGAKLGAFGSEASKETVTSGRLGGYRTVHFATHGILDARRPELSGLVLAGDGGGTGDETTLLRAHEVYDLDLPAELVVLSACETALGLQVRGEGLVGLTQGFFHAGAERVVVSLWQVGDRSTGALMERFYRRLLVSGRPPAAALREAQLSLLREERFAAPYHWAGFVLQGEWR